jgi:hypothetical protein
MLQNPGDFEESLMSKTVIRCIPLSLVFLLGVSTWATAAPPKWSTRDRTKAGVDRHRAQSFVTS